MPDNSTYIWQVMLGLLVILGIIFASAWLLRRLGHGGFVAGARMKVISSLPLGTRERAVMIEVGGRQILLGVAPGRISTLHVFSEPVIDTSGPEEKPESEFGQKIRTLLEKGKTP